MIPVWTRTYILGKKFTSTCGSPKLHFQQINYSLKIFHPVLAILDWVMVSSLMPYFNGCLVYVTPAERGPRGGSLRRANLHYWWHEPCCNPFFQRWEATLVLDCAAILSWSIKRHNIVFLYNLREIRSFAKISAFHLYFPCVLSLACSFIL